MNTFNKTFESMLTVVTGVFWFTIAVYVSSMLLGVIFTTILATIAGMMILGSLNG
jgi:hypothetical protein